jgi:hypothetical protein
VSWPHLQKFRFAYEYLKPLITFFQLDDRSSMLMRHSSLVSSLNACLGFAAPFLAIERSAVQHPKSELSKRALEVLRLGLRDSGDWNRVRAAEALLPMVLLRKQWTSS